MGSAVHTRHYGVMWGAAIRALVLKRFSEDRRRESLLGTLFQNTRSPGLSTVSQS